MGGPAPDGPEISPPGGPEEADRAARRRLALVQIAVGVPALFLCLFGLVVGYRLVGRPLTDGALLWVLVPIVGAFAIFLGRAGVVLARTGGSRPKE